MRLLADAGGYCSEHFHRYRHNLFIVHRGILRVRVETGPDSWDEHILTAGSQLLVDAGIFHQFDAHTDVVCDEIYYPKSGSYIDMDDIVRRTEGGRRCV